MAISVTHTYVSAIADEGDANEVGPDEWNAAHTLSGFGTGVETWLATPSSANLASAVTDETGTGALVFGTSPTFTTSALYTSGFVHSWNAGDVTLTHSANALTLAGKFGVGITPVVALQVSADGSTPAAALYSTSADNFLASNTTQSVIRLVGGHDAATTPGGAIVGLRARTLPSAPTVVQDGDVLLTILGQGYDGAARRTAASISYEVDGTPGSADMPGRLVFLTTPDGSSGPAEAMRIASTKVVTLAGTTASTSTTTGALVVSGGVGAAGELYVGGNSYFGSDVSIGINSFGTYPLYIYRDANGTRAVALKNANSGTGARCGFRVLNDLDQYFDAMMHSSTVPGYSSVAALDTSSTSIPFWLRTGGTVRVKVAGTGPVTFETSAPVTISSTTASTATNTGALIVSGGVGVAGALWLAAVSTTVAPLNFTGGGTLLTTAAAGAVEYDGNAFYATALASARQQVDAEQYIVATANSATYNNSGLDAATAAAVFTSTTNPSLSAGAVTVTAGKIYYFEFRYSLTNTGTTSHTWATLLAGTATFSTGSGYSVEGVSGTTASTPSTGGLMGNITSTTLSTAVVCTAASTSATEQVTIWGRGTLVINAGGTIIPQLKASARPGATGTPGVVLLAGSYFRIWQMGSTSHVGNCS